MTKRIDVHEHVIPPAYRAALTDAGIGRAGGRPLPEWSVESARDDGPAAGVQRRPVGLHARDDLPRGSVGPAALAAQVNDFSAGLAADHPGRFGFYATLPTPHPKHTMTEAERALDLLRADGVTLLPNSAGTYLGQPGLEPLFE